MNENLSKPNNNLAFKAGALYLIAEFITRGISFLATPAFSRLLPSAVFADSKIFESWTYLLAPIISLSLYQSMARAKFDYNEKFASYLSSTLSLIAVLTTIVLFAGIFLRNLAVRLLGFSAPLLLLMILYSFAYNGLQCVQLYERQLMHYKSNIILTMVSVIPGVVFSVLSVWKYASSASEMLLLNIRIISFFLPTTVIGFIVIIIAWAKGRVFYNPEQWQYGIRYSVPMMATTISSQIFFQSAIVIVRYVSGSDAAAVVAIAMTVGYIMDILVHAVDNAWRPWLYEQINEKKYSNVREMWTALIIGVSTLVWCFTMVAPELVMILGGATFKDATLLISPILCGSLANFLLIEYTALEQYYKKTRISGYASILSSIINIALNFLLVNLFGYQAVVYATAFAYIIACFIHFSMIRSFEKNDLMRTTFSFFVIAGCFVLCMISMASFALSLAFRLLIILIVLTCVSFAMRKKLKAMINVFIKKNSNK